MFDDIAIDDIEPYTLAALCASFFTLKLSGLCEEVNPSTEREPFHESAEEIIKVLYLYLYETEQITYKTRYYDVCCYINKAATNFFNLDVSNCSDTTKSRYTIIKKYEMDCLNHDSTKNLMLLDFRTVFDITCAGKFIFKKPK